MIDFPLHIVKGIFMVATTNTKTEILSAIGKTDDHNLKMVLLLMLGIMEEIGGKIDGIYQDKEMLRESVLNGHADVHHSDHEWIKHHRIEDLQRLQVIQRLEPVLTWAEQKIIDERTTNTLVKRKSVDIISNIAEKGIWLIFGMLAYAVASGFPLAQKFFG